MGLWCRPAQSAARLGRLGIPAFLVGVVVYQCFFSQSHTAFGSFDHLSSNKVPARNLSTYLRGSEGFYAARTMRFEVCNGYANQRLAIAYGVVILLLKQAIDRRSFAAPKSLSTLVSLLSVGHRQLPWEGSCTARCAHEWHTGF